MQRREEKKITLRVPAQLRRWKMLNSMTTDLKVNMEDSSAFLLTNAPANNVWNSRIVRQ